MPATAGGTTSSRATAASDTSRRRTGATGMSTTAAARPATSRRATAAAGTSTPATPRLATSRPAMAAAGTSTRATRARATSRAVLQPPPQARLCCSCRAARRRRREPTAHLALCSSGRSLDRRPVKRGDRSVDPVGMASRTLALRRPDRCAVCAAELPGGTRARWDAETRTVTCLGCVGAETGSSAPALSRPDPGSAGASAGREYQRRRRNREQRTRTAHPHIGGLLLALQGEPQQQLAFRRGQHGEVAVAESLRRRTVDNVVLLHDRRTPGGRGNIDPLVIAPTGVYVVDAKDHKGRVSISTPLFGEAKLMIDGRDRTKLIDGLDRQFAAVRDALATLADPPPVHGVLCFTKADLPLLGTTSMRSHLLLTRKGLAKRLNAGGPLSSPAIEEMARTLTAAFPPA